MHLRPRALLLGILSLSLSALAPSPALARRPAPQPTAQCAVIPNPVSNDVAAQYTVVGSGFTFGQTLDVFVIGPTGATTIYMVSADSAGNFSAIGWAPFLVDDGQWSVNVYQAGDRRMRVLASCSFQVI